MEENKKEKRENKRRQKKKKEEKKKKRKKIYALRTSIYRRNSQKDGTDLDNEGTRDIVYSLSTYPKRSLGQALPNKSAGIKREPTSGGQSWAQGGPYGRPLKKKKCKR